MLFCIVHLMRNNKRFLLLALGFFLSLDIANDIFLVLDNLTDLMYEHVHDYIFPQFCEDKVILD